MVLTGNAKKAGVMGWPVAHSRSPRLHGYWLAQYGIDGAYVPLPVEPRHFEAAVRALPKLGFSGANVTVPHKEAALRLADRVSENARRIGAVNALFVQEDGSISGDNTDGFGFMENLTSGAPRWRARAGPGLVLGAGGAARAVVLALLDAGVPEVRLSNRTLARAETVASDLEGGITVVAWDDRHQACEGVGVLVNCTSLGMSGQPRLEIDLSALPPAAVVNDIVYAPLMTELLEQARARGHTIVDGLGMLLHQARPAFRAWFGRDPEVTPALREFVIGD